MEKSISTFLPSSFWNTWCSGCINAKDKHYDDIAPISYYCQKRGFRVPAFHPTVDCKDYANDEKEE